MGAVKERLTAEQINSLPEFAREWIHDLARNADPAGTLAELRLLQEAFKAQEILITELRGEIEVPDEGALSCSMRRVSVFCEDRMGFMVDWNPAESKLSDALRR
jgi:hypothetical protein